ncbi:unnamed protein product [Cunninghamella echinulata]
MVKKTLLWSAIVASFAAVSNVLAAEDILDKELILVEFFAPWCGHCKALAPEYEKAATELKDTIPLAKVDCTENEKLCQDQGVQGFPTLKVFRKGDASEYKGSRQHEGIVSYMKKQSLPAVSDLTEVSALNDFKTSDRIVAVAYIKEDDKESKEAYADLANKLRDDYIFGLVTDDALAKEEGVKEFPSLVLYRKFDDERIELASGSGDEWQSFIKDNSLPILDQISGENFATYMETGLPLAYIFTDNADDHDKLDEIIRPVAKAFKGKVSFAHIDASLYGGHARNVGLKEGEWPSFAIQNLKTAAKYPLQVAEITTDAVQDFLERFTKGEVEPSLNSEEIPESNDGPVKVVVGKQFNDIVLDKSKDVFLEVYAPWCGHCKNLAPTWEALGKVIQENKIDNVVIAKLDGTENDIPPEAGFKVEGFPTLKFFKAETNEIIDYNGDRSYETLAEFINTHASDKSVKLDTTPPPIEEAKEEEQPETKKEEEVEQEEEALEHDEL